jgi:CubicO group peptidase (beta-lactamase class C family)
VDKAFVEPISCTLETRAVVVYHRDRIIYKKYADSFNENTSLLGWSMTKSALNALVGILVRKGVLAENQTHFMPQWSDDDDPRRDITLKEMLQMNSGLDFVEWYLPSDDATTMLYFQGDMATYASAKQFKYYECRPWAYSSGTTNMLSRMVKRALGDDQQRYYEFPQKELFNPLGMTSAVLEPDESGTFVMSSYMYATARDWARFGALYLNDGIWRGRRILDSKWIKDSVTPVPAAKKGQYGYHWWLNHGIGDMGCNRGWASLPNDIFSAEGHNGQLVAVIPSYCLLVVRLGMSGFSCFDKEAFLTDILKAFNLPGQERLGQVY